MVVLQDYVSHDFCCDNLLDGRVLFCAEINEMVMVTVISMCERVGLRTKSF